MVFHEEARLITRAV